MNGIYKMRMAAVTEIIGYVDGVNAVMAEEIKLSERTLRKLASKCRQRLQIIATTSTKK